MTALPKDEAVAFTPAQAVQLFAAQAVRTPDAIAVVFGDTRITYAELDYRGNQLARRLRRLGVGPDVLVGVHSERSVSWIVGLLAVLKAGGAYLPLDPVYPTERLASMVADSRPPVILVENGLESRLPTSSASVVPLAGSDGTDRESGAAIDVVSSPDNLAYAVYTSGSTGVPKAVLVANEAVTNLLGWHHRTIGISPADRCLQQARMGFDACLFEVLPCLVAGATLHLLDDTTRTSPEAMRTWLVDNRITVAFLPPVLGEALFDLDLSDLALRVLFTGSDKAHRFPPPSLAATYINCYGPTEAAVIVTAGQVRAADQADAPSIGRPIDGAELHVVDDRLRELPDGEVGELCIGGRPLARGYLNDAARTADRFVPDPFSGRPGARLYRTGDLVRKAPDGTYEFHGRADDQVKLRGYRVELGEVEAALRRHPGIRDARAVVGDDAVPGLTAYLLADTEPSLPALRRFLYRALPYYMVPSSFVVVDEWPVSANGKLDRERLTAAGRRLGEGEPRPLSHEERELAAIWADLLGVADVGPDDNFFSLGGHSLLGMQLMSRIRDAFGVSVPLRRLFDSPTLADCAAAVRRGGDQGHVREPGIVPVARDQDLPLSFSQRRIWLLQRMFPDNRAYNFQTTFVLRGNLDVPVLRESLHALTQRHEVYRTTFPDRGGAPYQRIHASCPLCVDLVDLTTLPPEQRVAEADRIAQRCMAEVFDLTTLPLVRWTLVRLASDEYHLVHVEHHLVHDGWSFTVVIEELLRLYQARVEGRRPGLPDLEVQFADYAHWQHEWAATEEARRQAAYWRRQLTDSPAVVTIPPDRSRPDTQSLHGAMVRAELPGELAGALRRLAHTEHATLFLSLLAVFEVLLQRYTGQDDIVIGTAVANRTRPETERLVGMLVNNLVLRVDLSGDPTFRQVLGRVREVVLGAHAHQDTPFDQVVRDLNRDRDISHNPLYQVSFSFHDSPMPALTLPGLDVSLVEGMSNGTAKFDLNIIAIPHVEQSVGRVDAPDRTGVTMLFEYCTDLYEAETIERVIRHYQRIAERAVADPDLRISRLSPLDESERRQLLGEWSSGTDAPVVAGSLRELLDRIPAHDTESVADAIGYRELAADAHRLSHRLAVRGAGPERLVRLDLPDLRDRLTGMLAVLLVGAAVVGPDVSGMDDSALVLTAADLTAEGVGESHGAGVPHRANAAYVTRAGEAEVVLTYANVLHLVTVLWHDFRVAAGDLVFVRETDGSSALAALAALIAGARIAREPGPGARVLTLEGFPETTFVSLTGEDGARRLGAPVVNTHVYVLDRNGEPTPIGVAGELCLGGAGVARGYRDDPTLTAERFVPDPFSPVPGATLFRTGRQARRLAGGGLEYHVTGESEPAPTERQRPYTAPRTDTEQRLARQWAELLRVDRVGVDDNFFALGGQSLLAMMAVSRAQEEFAADVPATAIFRCPTIARFAVVVEESGPLTDEPLRALSRSARTLDSLLSEVDGQ